MKKHILLATAASAFVLFAPLSRELVAAGTSADEAHLKRIEDRGFHHGWPRWENGAANAHVTPIAKK